MEQNILENMKIDGENFSPLFQHVFVAPDCINFFLLAIVLYQMYQRIEVKHPLYAVLFLNLVVSLLCAIANILLFYFVPTFTFVRFSRIQGGVYLFFHCTSWCVTSVIRYIYIVHDDWIDRFIPSPRMQCQVALALAILFSVSMSAPVVGYIFYLGKIFYNCKKFLSFH